ncbi:P63C domain-containing protein [Flavobacterium sp.]|uniref:P63C domain-containing protein n=1 Tax=Flavobacterium sp. TaxID=239 RepID=UPI0025D613D0|nr:P63C domain-containing protein [Flavobacterium sp.]
MKNKNLEAKYGSSDSPLMIGDIEIPCYVLEDGKRVIVQRGLFKALGINYGGTTNKELKEFGGAARLVAFMDNNSIFNANNSAELNEIKLLLKSPIKFELNGVIHFGYEATLLQEITKSISKAYLKGTLPARNNEIGRNAEILYDAFAKVGIIALVDEATGYQEVREKTALKEFLAQFLKDEKGKWVQTYDDSFFEAIFRMKGWNWSIANKGKKPQVVGHYINNYVYSRLAPQILIELRKLNPKDEKGNRKGKFTQWIEPNFGHPKLKEHLAVLTALAKASGHNWKNWERMVERALPKFGSDGSQSPELPFDEVD